MYFLSSRVACSLLQKHTQNITPVLVREKNVSSTHLKCEISEAWKKIYSHLGCFNGNGLVRDKSFYSSSEVWGFNSTANPEEPE